MQQNEPLDLSCCPSSRSDLSEIQHEDADKAVEIGTICDQIRPVNVAPREISKIKFLASLELTPVSLKEDTHDVPVFGYAVQNDSRLLRVDIRPYTSIYWSILAHHNLLPRGECRLRGLSEYKTDSLPLDLSLRKETFETKIHCHNEKMIVKQKQRRYRTEKPFVCTHCSARFTLRSNMIRHIKQQHAESCNRRQESQKPPELSEFSKQQTQQAHDWARNIFVDEYVESPCHMSSSYYFEEEDDDAVSFTDYYSLSELGLEASKRKSAYSTAPNRVSCPYCSREFPWNSSLRRHILTHTGQKPFKCDFCSLLFTTKSNCDRHTARKHVESRKMTGSNSTDSGDIGSDGSESSQDAQDKFKVASPYESSFKCYLCNSAFSDRQAALDHFKDEHSLDYASLIPNLTVTAVNGSSVVADEINDPNVNCSNRKVICALCRRRFWSTEDLRRHMRTHTGERPFCCDLCSRRFTLKHSMLRHMKKHEPGLKKY